MTCGAALQKLTCGTEHCNNFSSPPLVGIDRGWPALFAKRR
jgi:hypothetical protein